MYYIEVFNALKSSFFMGNHFALYMLACGVACIVACFALIAWYNHWQNDPYGLVDIKAIIRIVTILLLVCNFYPMVMIPLDSVTSIVTRGITISVKEDKASMESKLKQAYQDVENFVTHNTMRSQFEQLLDDGTSSTSLDNGASGGTNSVLESTVESNVNNSNKKSFWSKVWDTLKCTLQEIMGFPYKAGSTIISFAISCIVDFVRFVMVIISCIYLILLGMIGPFTFALAIMPSFKGGISNWVARYIQISFWVPVCSMIDYVNIHIKDALLGVFANHNMVEQAVFPCFFIILVDVATIAMLLAVPSISSWIVSSDGAGGANRSIVNAAMKAAKVVAK